MTEYDTIRILKRPSRREMALLILELVNSRGGVVSTERLEEVLISHGWTLKEFTYIEKHD